MTKDRAVKVAKKPMVRTRIVRKTTSQTVADETPPVVVTMADLMAKPPRFTTAQRARLDAMSQDEIDGKADADPVNPTWSGEDLRRAAFAGRVREARARTGLSQPLFAARFHIAVSRLRDWERGRFKPDSVADAYITTILANPKAVERALTSNRGA